MAYEPTQWKKGDIVTSEKLNKMEQGIASASLLVETETAEIDSGFYYVSEVETDEILAVLCSGGIVTVHFPKSEYSRELYFHLTGYMPEDSTAGNSDELWYYDEAVGSNITGCSVTDDGYLAFEIYID